jgi:carboxyl-terminal processing protease
MLLTFFFFTSVDPVGYAPTEISRVKSVDKYWAETGISPEELGEVVNNTTCASSLRYFLACVNSVSNILYRNNQMLSRDGEKLTVKPLDPNKETTERQLLEPWRKVYLSSQDTAKKLDFQGLIQETLENSDSPATMIAAGLNGFLSIFKDPHTYIIPVDYYQEVVAKSSPRTKSLGVIVSKTQDQFYIRKVLAQSPASSMGVKKGDVLLAVNDQKIVDQTSVKVNELLKSEETFVKLKLKRQNQIIEIIVPRHEVELPSVSYDILNSSKKVAVLSINKFSKGACGLTEKALKEIIKSNLDGVILDLRDNSGGQIEEAACIGGLFLGTKKKLFELHFFDQDRPREPVYSGKEILYTGALAILINRGSASASELLAGSLRDYGRALLVGEVTYGKGTFQEGEVWNHNPKIAMFSTRGFYLLPSGYSPQLHGLVPDIEVKFMNDTQPREYDQYFYALNPPGGPYFASLRDKQKLVAINNCGGSDRAGDDKQLSKAAQVLFCMQPVAGVANDIDDSF